MCIGLVLVVVVVVDVVVVSIVVDVVVASIVVGVVGPYEHKTVTQGGFVFFFFAGDIFFGKGR